MSPYAPANGSSASSVASTASVLSGRPRTLASTSSPAPASANRTPALSSGGTSSSPILIVTHVDDQMTTLRAYRDQMTARDTAGEGKSRPTTLKYGCLE